MLTSVDTFSKLISVVATFNCLLTVPENLYGDAAKDLYRNEHDVAGDFSFLIAEKREQ